MNQNRTSQTITANSLKLSPPSLFTSLSLFLASFLFLILSCCLYNTETSSHTERDHESRGKLASVLDRVCNSVACSGSHLPPRRHSSFAPDARACVCIVYIAASSRIKCNAECREKQKVGKRWRGTGETQRDKNTTTVTTTTGGSSSSSSSSSSSLPRVFCCCYCRIQSATNTYTS